MILDRKSRYESGLLFNMVHLFNFIWRIEASETQSFLERFQGVFNVIVDLKYPVQSSQS